MKTKPAISVVIPNYNYAHYLGECMQSVIDQTFTDWELIVVDDGSTDNSRKVAEDFIKKYPDKRIKYIYKEDGPSGTPAAINLGIKNMKGEYFAWLSSDDVYLPDKLGVQYKYMEENPEIAITHTNYLQINEKSEVFGKHDQKHIDSVRKIELLKGNFINGNTVLIRKCIFEKVGLFRENDEEYNNEFPEIWRATEYEKWIEIGMNFKISLIPQYLHKARFHHENTPYDGTNARMSNMVARRIVEKSRIEDIFPALKELPQDQILYLNSLLELLSLCHRREWFDLAKKYLMKIGEIKKELWEEISRSFLQGIEGLSSAEVAKIILMKTKKYFVIKSNTINEFSKLGIQEGISLLQKGDYTKGKKVFEEWVEITPESVELNYSLGSCYQKEGEFSKAIEKFQKVLSYSVGDRKTYYAGAHFHLGEICQMQGRLEEARIEFEECLRLNPDHKVAEEKLFAIDQKVSLTAIGEKDSKKVLTEY